MKKTMILAAIAAAGVATYIIRKRRAAKNVMEPANEPGRAHLTDAFSKAKKYATGSMSMG